MSLFPRELRFDVFLCGAAALGAALVISTGSHPTTSELIARRENLFPAFNPNSVESIQLVSKESGSEVFLRRDSESDDPHRYFLGRKGRRIADLSQMANLVSALEFSSWTRLLAEKSAPSDEQLGFSNPQAELRINAGPRSYRLLIGSRTPTEENSVYARVEGTSVSSRTGVVSDELAKKIASENQEFRGSALFPYSKISTSSLSISSEKHQLQLTADHLGFLLKNERSTSVVRADRELSDLIFYQLARASVTQFLDEKTVRNGLQRDPGRVTVEQRGPTGPHYRCIVGGDCPGDPSSTLAMRLAPDRVQGCITRSVLPALKMAPQELQSVLATPLRADEIDHIIVKEEKRQLDLVRRGAQYSLLSHNSRVIDSDVGDELLAALANGKLDAAIKPENPQKFSSIRIVGNSSLSAEPPVPLPNGSGSPSRAAELQLSTYRKGEQLFLHREDDDQWFRIPSWLTWAYSADNSWTKKRRFFQETTLVQATVQYPSGHTETVTRANKDLTFNGDQFDVDQKLAERLFDEIEHLEAARFLPEDTPSPSDVLLQLDWSSSQSPDDRNTLRIGPRTRGGFLATSNFTKGVFVLPLRTVSTFKMPLTSRLPANINAREIIRLEARADGRVYKFEKRAGVLSADGGEATDDMVHPLMEAIQGIRVLAAAGSHPVAHSLDRGSTRLVLAGVHSVEGEERTFTLHIGAPTVFENESAFVGWLEGQEENYVLSRRGIDALIALL